MRAKACPKVMGQILRSLVLTLILSGGEISVSTQDGIVRVKAPFTLISPPGTKSIAYAHTECTWTTILATEETDPDKIEASFKAVARALRDAVRIEGTGVPSTKGRL